MNPSYINNLAKPILIVGLGKSGKSAHNLLMSAGVASDSIFTFDEKLETAQIRSPQKAEALGAKTLVVSPGVPLNTSWIVKARENGAHITSEINLAASLLTTERLIGITGSLGKSTVTSLIGVGAKFMDPTAFVGGNLGIPFCEYALQKISTGKTAQWVVLELSSYQLENCELLKLNHSVVSYLSANHLERYENVEHYYSTKLKITEITSGVCVFNRTSPDCVNYVSRSKCDALLVNAESFTNQKLLNDVYLIGRHNKDNFAIAAEIALLSGWSEQALTEMASYRGLEHRLEFVASIDGVTYVNDSKATAMDSVLVAAKGCLEGLDKEKKLYLLLGGKDKNLPWQDLAVLGSSENLIPVFFGSCGVLAKEKSGLQGEIFEKLGSAINFSQKRAQNGDVVLLSPGGTSLDEFKNFEERGDFFKTLVLSQIDA